MRERPKRGNGDDDMGIVNISLIVIAVNWVIGLVSLLIRAYQEDETIEIDEIFPLMIISFFGIVIPYMFWKNRRKNKF